MASVNYMYRSIKDEAALSIRLTFKHEKDRIIGAKTKTKVTRQYWNEIHGKPLQHIRDTDHIITYNRINAQLPKLERHILNAFEAANTAKVDKDWLKDVIAEFYDPAANDPIPRDLIGYMGYYLEYEANELSHKNRLKMNVTLNKMKRLQMELGAPILIKEINEDFKKEYIEYCKNERYSPNTRARELNLIKQIVRHAKNAGLETHHQLNGLRLKSKAVNHIYLTPGELETIEALDLPFDYLENARDWLLISCHTGQRVSDFMRFDPGMIRKEGGKFLLEFKQQKTGKQMSIPLARKVRDILEKRGGKFPRKISDQKYNDYIKVVSEASGLNEVCEGKRRINIANEGEKAKYRDVMGEYPKWKLVSSHIGRRSFATNNYGRVPTSYLIHITGHGSEAMFLKYIKKSAKDIALDAYGYFD